MVVVVYAPKQRQDEGLAMARPLAQKGFLQATLELRPAEKFLPAELEECVAVMAPMGEAYDHIVSAYRGRGTPVARYGLPQAMGIGGTRQAILVATDSICDEILRLPEVKLRVLVGCLGGEMVERLLAAEGADRKRDAVLELLGARQEALS